MPTGSLDFLQALAQLLNWGVGVERAILTLENARRRGTYTAVEPHHTYIVSYDKNGWTIAIA